MPNQSDPTQPVINPPAPADTSPAVPDFQTADIPPMPADNSQVPQIPVVNDQVEPSPDLPPVISPPPKKKFGGGKIIATILGFLILVGGLGTGIVLVKQRQLFSQKAGGTPCGPIGGDACGGDCPAGKSCQRFGLTCSCDVVTTCENATAPSCSGFCPEGSSCKLNSESGKCDCSGGPGGCQITAPSDLSVTWLSGNTQAKGTWTPGIHGRWQTLFVSTDRTKIDGKDMPCGVNTGQESDCVIKIHTEGNSWKEYTSPTGKLDSNTIYYWRVFNWYTSDKCYAGSNIAELKKPNGPTPTPTSTPTSTPVGECKECNAQKQCVLRTCTGAQSCNSNADCAKTPTPTPTPTSPGVLGRCVGIKAYDSEWEPLPLAYRGGEETIKVGDKIFFAVKGEKGPGIYDQARFMVNGVEKPEWLTDKTNENGEFFITYTVLKADVGKSISVKAKIHNTPVGWSEY